MTTLLDVISLIVSISISIIPLSSFSGQVHLALRAFRHNVTMANYTVTGSFNFINRLCKMHYCKCIFEHSDFLFRDVPLVMLLQKLKGSNQLFTISILITDSSTMLLCREVHLALGTFSCRCISV